jgi:hypothetical protein
MISPGDIKIYVDDLTEHADTVVCVGIDPPDDMGLVFCYYKSINDNGSKNCNEHPVYGKYYVIQELNSEYIVDPEEAYQEYEDLHNPMKFYKRDM